MWIEVAYATPKKQVIKRLDVEAGSRVEQAIAQAALEKDFPDLQILPGGVGIFSKPVKLDQVLQEGDRVEIYRPLTADPKDARKERAEKA
jgi:putative ubiquitin-RnfH superfamily antitoxin RatB of RatAB toxin-antitoxin module